LKSHGDTRQTNKFIYISMVIANRHTHLLQVVGVIIALFFQSCAAHYATNMVNTPMLKQQGDLQIGGSVGHLGLNGQLAYAVSDNVGVMVNGKQHEAWYADDLATSNTVMFVEAGAGYYKWLSEHTIVELYGGYGLGEVNLVHAQKNTDITYILSRPFLQPSIGVQADFFSLNLATRLTHAGLRSDSIELSGLFIEPAITTKLQFEQLSAIYQMGIVRTLHTDTPEMQVLPFWLAFGFQYNFDFTKND
jgi:hypothetical protein